VHQCDRLRLLRVLFDQDDVPVEISVMTMIATGGAYATS
jgi:hypothetical protein